MEGDLSIYPEAEHRVAKGLINLGEKAWGGLTAH